MLDALYLHIPFCVRRCRYCDFVSSAVGHGDPAIVRYVDALAGVLGRLAQNGLLSHVSTAYIGGGTPTMAGGGLVRLVRAVRAAAPRIEELSVEANPESLPAELVARLADAGVTRVSLGVQSTNDVELERLGRAHRADQALAAARFVVGEGLDLSCDLMCGIPLQTPASWGRCVREVLEVGAGHISCYPLTVEEGTALAAAVDRGDERMPDEDLQADLMEIAQRIAHGRGLARYEVASYALPGKVCRHNVAYWTGRLYGGVGSAAASMFDRDVLAAWDDALPLSAYDASVPPCDGGGAGGMAVRTYFAQHPDAVRLRVRMMDGPDAFVRSVARGWPLKVEVEPLTAREAAAEDLMLGMRMSCGVHDDTIRRAVRAGICEDDLERTFADLERRGLVMRPAAGGMAPTHAGWLLGNEIFGALWGLA